MTGKNGVSGDEFDFVLFEPLPDRRGLCVPGLEGINVAIKPSAGTSSEAVP